VDLKWLVMNFHLAYEKGVPLAHPSLDLDVQNSIHILVNSHLRELSAASFMIDRLGRAIKLASSSLSFTPH